MQSTSQSCTSLNDLTVPSVDPADVTTAVSRVLASALDTEESSPDASPMDVDVVVNVDVDADADVNVNGGDVRSSTVGEDEKKNPESAEEAHLSVAMQR